MRRAGAIVFRNRPDWPICSLRKRNESCETEPILIFQKGKYRHPPAKPESKIDRNEYPSRKWLLSVWEMRNQLPTRKKKYPTAFPPELPYRLIKLYSSVGEIVLDPFLGSGTTMRAGWETGRSCIGYEIDERPRDVIQARLSDVGRQCHRVHHG